MDEHILAEVEVFDPQACHVAPHASDEWTVADVSRSSRWNGDGTVLEEFTLTGEEGAETPAVAEHGDVERVFSSETEEIYQFSREADQGCICERVEWEGCVVHDVRGDGDSLVVTFLVDDTDTLRAVISELEDTGESITLRRLVEGTDGLGSGRPTVLDRDVLTDRQAEVLERAHGMGYFEHPREATAGEVAERLDITTSTFTEHLAAAQRKLLDDLLAH